MAIRDAQVEFRDFLILSNNLGAKTSVTCAGAGKANWEELTI